MLKLKIKNWGQVILYSLIPIMIITAFVAGFTLVVTSLLTLS